MTTHQRNLVAQDGADNFVNVKCEANGTIKTSLTAQNPDEKFVNVKVGYHGHVETNNMKTTFGETTTAQLTPVLQEIFPYTINTRVWTKTETNATVSFLNNMAEMTTTADDTAQAIMVSKKRIKYRTRTGIMCRFTALWDIDETEGYQSFIGIGESDVNNGFYFLWMMPPECTFFIQ